MKGKASKSSLCVLTVCADAATVDSVMRATLQVFAAQFVGELSSYLTRNGNLEILQRAQTSDTCVCVIDFDRDRVQAVQTANAMQQMFGTRITLVALSEKADPDLILDAMRSGCSEYLIKPLQVEQLCESLVRLQGRWAATQSALAVRGRTQVFLGTRGGAGTTTLAVHLATFLSEEFGKKTLLIDHHDQLGHVGLYLGLEPTHYDFSELVRNVDRLDETLVNGFLAHHGSGVDVIVSSDVFDPLPDVPLDHAERTLQFLSGLYEYILLDCDRGFGAANLGLIDQADELYLIATPDVPALRDLSRCVDRLMQSNISPGKLKVAINRYSSAGAVTLQQIEKAIRQPISITIPNNASELIRAMNTGTPLGPASRSDFAMQMRKWAASLVPGAAEPKDVSAPKCRFAFWS